MRIVEQTLFDLFILAEFQFFDMFSQFFIYTYCLMWVWMTKFKNLMKKNIIIENSKRWLTKIYPLYLM